MEFSRLERRDAVVVLTWEHEEQNRFTTPFLREFREALATLAEDRDVHGVVVTSGLEKFFSTGLHLEWMQAQAAKGRENLLAMLREVNGALLDATGFPKPLVAAINGHVAAAGAILAACVDYRFMRADQGLVRLPEVHIGIPFWPGMTAIFQDILPPASLRDMLLTGERFTADQARALGYVDEVVPAEELIPRAVARAAALGSAQPQAFAAVKRGIRARVLRIMRESDPLEFEPSLRLFGL